MAYHPVDACAPASAGRTPGGLWRLALWPLLFAVLSACGDTTDGIGVVEDVVCAPDPGGSIAFPSLPVRAPPPAVTTGSVPHRQIDPIIIPSVIAELHERVFALSEVESRESLLVAGATAVWIRPEINVGRPECIVAGREVAHIHADGSLHAVLPLGRIPAAESAGWVERHPWSGLQPGFEAFVLIFSPRSSEEIDVAFDLIGEGLNFVTEG